MTVKQLAAMHGKTHASAWERLAERITTGRAYRTRQYDVLLPQTSPSPKGAAVPEAQTTTTTACEQRRQEAILFLPGSGVEHTAYAEPALLLSDQGFVVVVVLAEPHRNASIVMGFDAAYMKQIQSSVEQQVGKKQVESTTPRCRWSWSVLGHSLGSFTMTHLAATMPGLNRVIMRGSAPFLAHVCDLSAAIDKHMLAVQGSHDRVIDMLCAAAHTAAAAQMDGNKKNSVDEDNDDVDLMQQFYRKLPPHTTTVRTVPGGTHSGFASYTSAWKTEIVTDTTPQQQHAQAVLWTVEFLRSTPEPL